MSSIPCGTRTLLIVVLAIQLAFLGSIGLDFVDIKIPIIRQAISHIYLSLLPGILILRILKIHKLALIETVLYSLGLSLALLMLAGATANFLNFLYPLKPISELPLILIFSITTLILSLGCYVRDLDYVGNFSFDISKTFSNSNLFLLLLPFLAIFGTYLVNFYNNNILLLVLLFTIAAIPFAIIFNKINMESYPFVMWIVSVSLLLHNSLISIYISGIDINSEYYFANMVIQNGFWNSSFKDFINAMLSIVIMAPIFSEIGNISLTYVYKLTYVFFFSLIPVGLYHIFRQQMEARIALLSSYFFTSFFIFYTEMLTLSRQEIAEFFLICLIVSMTSRDLTDYRKALLSIIFLFSIAVSHYGLSYLLIIMFLLVYLLNYIINNNRNGPNYITTGRFIALSIIFAITYYTYTAGSSIFEAFLGIGKNLMVNIIDIYNPANSNIAFYMSRTDLSPLYDVFKYFNYITQIFILIGIWGLLRRKYSNEFNNEYKLYSIAALCMWFACFIPGFASDSSFGLTRIYHITLFFLAPFCIIGGIMSIKTLCNTASLKIEEKQIYKIISFILALFLLFNSSLIFYMANDYCTSISLNKNIAKEISGPVSLKTKVAFYNAYLPEEDVFSAIWLSAHYCIAQSIYADAIGKRNVLNSYGNISRIEIDELKQGDSPRNNSLIYLRKFNYADGILIGPGIYKRWNISELAIPCKTYNKIYADNIYVIF